MSFVNLNDLNEKQPVFGFHGRFVHSDHMTLAYWNIDAGSSLPEHAHSHEQFVNLIEGNFEFTLNGETRVLQAGSVVVIPSNITHSGKAISHCKIIDVFYPVREDYRKE